MKLIDTIKDKGRDELPQILLNMGYKVGAEIGVYRGEFTEKLCKAGLKVFAIDPWTSFQGQGRSEEKQSMQDTNYEYAQKKLAAYQDCTLIKKSSMDALSNFTPESLDFVYIDGDHKFRYIAEDICEWYGKVRKGGIIAGHDYYTTSPSASNLICQVKPVVDAFIETYDIKEFCTFGSKDKYLSWIFVKPL